MMQWKQLYVDITSIRPCQVGLKVATVQTTHGSPSVETPKSYTLLTIYATLNL